MTQNSHLQSFGVFSFLDSLSSLLFPSCCIHCKDDLPQSLNLMCGACLELLELIEPTTRCPLCFSECCICSKAQRQSYSRLGCCFEYEGPQKSLLVALKYRDMPYLAKSLAAFLFLQHQSLEWQVPDIITYIPQSFLRASTRGYNQSALLAKNLSKLMHVPVKSLLKRTCFSVSQTQATKDERRLLSADTFTCKPNENFQNKHILLIDDVLTTGTTIEYASHALEILNPKTIDVLCLMRTEI